MISREWAEQFAIEWIDAWNSHDLERILSHYTDDFEMSSPLIVDRMKVSSGTLKGKETIRLYWQKGLTATPPLKFELISVFVGANSLALQYRRISGVIAIEVLVFDVEGKVVSGIAHYL